MNKESLGQKEPWNPDIVYALARCRKCREVSLFRYEHSDGRWGAPSQVWPETQTGLHYYIPSALRVEFEEAQRCYSAKAFTASTVMVRPTLEGVCDDRGVAAKTLVAELRELEQRGKPDGRFIEWTDALRVLGNRGAHYTGSPVSRAAARDALDFARALLDYLYVYTQRFEGRSKAS